MSGAKLATGWLELVVSTPGAQKQISDAVAPAATKAGDRAGSSIGSSLMGGLKRFAGPIAAIAAGFSVAKLVQSSEKAFMGLALQTAALQRVAGGTKTEVSGLVGAMQLSGVSVDKVSPSLIIFSKNLGKASRDTTKTAELTKLMGVDFKDAAGNVKPMAQILPGLSDTFKKMPDGAQKTALATQLFGRSGAQLLPFLNKGSAGIADLTKQATKMGLVLDDVSGRIFAQARTSTRNYQAATQGLLVQLGQSLVPVLTSVKNVYRSAMIPVLQAVTGFLISHRDSFLKVADGAQKFADRVGAVVTGLIALVSHGDSGGLGKALGIDANSPVIGVVLGIRDAVITAFGAIKSSVGQVFQALAPAFAQLGPVFAQLLPPLIQLWQSLSPASLIFKSLLPVLPQIAGVVGQLAASLGGALATALAAILPAVSTVASVLSGALTTVLQLLIPIIVQLATTLGGVLASTMTTLAPIVAQIATVLGQVLGSVLTALMPIITLLATLLGSVLQAVLPLIGPILGLVAPLLQLIVPIVTLVGSLLTPLIQLLTTLLTPILSLITPIIGLLVPAIQAIVTVLSVVIGWIVQAIAWFVKLVTGNQQAGAQFQAVWRAVMGFFGGIGRFFSNIWNGIINNIAGFVGRVVGFFQSIPQKIISVFAGAGSWLVSVGRNLIDGLINGASGLLRNIGNFFLSIIPGWILGPFKAALGIASPSKVFFGLGENTVQGYINGVMGSKGAVNSTLSGLVSVPSVSTSGRSAVGAAVSRGAGVNIEKIVAPDQNVVVAGRIMGREIDRLLGGLT